MASKTRKIKKSTEKNLGLSYKNKRTRENRILTIIVLFAVILVEICIIFGTKRFRYGYNVEKMGVTADTLVEKNGYNVTGTKFEATEEGANIVFAINLSVTNKFTILFNEKLNEDKDVTVYYDDGKGFSGEKAKTVVLEKNEDLVNIDVPNGEYTRIMLCIPGEFDLNNIVVDGKKLKKDDMLLCITLCVCAVLDYVIYLFVREILRRRRKDVRIGSIIKSIPIQLLGFNKIINNFLVEFSEKIKLNIVNFFTISGLIMGILMSIIVPTAQVPDEPAHFEQIVSEWGLSEYYSGYLEYINNIQAGEMMGHSDVKMDVSKFKKNLNNRFDVNGMLKIHFHFNVSIIKHFPMAIGLIIGILLKLPVYFSVQLAELGAIIFFVVMGRISLKIMPIKRELLCAIMLLPMSLQQCSSINYDAVLLPLCYFLIAFILNLRYREAKVKWKDILGVCVVMFCIMVIKLPYVMLGLLIFTIRKEKYDLKIGSRYELVSLIFKYKFVPVILSIFMIFFGLYIMRNNYYIKVIIASVKNLKQYLKIFHNTLNTYGDEYKKSFIGKFGWMDCEVSDTFMNFIFLSLLIFAQKKNENIKENSSYLRIRILSAMSFISIFILVVTVMITWSFTMKGINVTENVNSISKGLNHLNVIEGVQGRYFLPVAFCGYMVVSQILKLKNIAVYSIIYYLVVFGQTLNLLIGRYWF